MLIKFPLHNYVHTLKIWLLVGHKHVDPSIVPTYDCWVCTCILYVMWRACVGHIYAPRPLLVNVYFMRTICHSLLLAMKLSVQPPALYPNSQYS